ncbi:hypothetical protein N181_25025 [Sinorhizobium fredii USDA 205]|uniref:Uncharacterized protein n=1 Tax=Rhizobium fredii TaxID=380 RepID=A0A844AB60_RHIFR|nr:hypothetical protein [Sinorhizobium fredii]AWM27611.1 hypothetical protein AOX55_00004832 [Sinorhizobium fredii CCBAU 25509]ASY73332.1 hypothetical protein SF83666_b66830 [Sinorhizobium fredii CCBAU 83666]KSV83751.1 hypothetical protein N181_25025 [Sinorhizobium fredii USDA 205]MQW96603.1 hypothetical protein [Sinorhizobium fredii]MQX09571.1 hypothetical protein [Sinorhizobium fredii]
MLRRDRHNTQSTAFPIGLLLLAIGAILAYLAVGGAWSDNRTETAVYAPQTIDNSKPR